jgi:hypothetical protein
VVFFAIVLSFGMAGKVSAPAMILLRRKGFDPDIAENLRGFEHESARVGSRMVGWKVGVLA